MKHPSFFEARETVAQWVESNHKTLKNKRVSIVTLKDDEACLRVELNFGECLSEIIVSEPDFAPYRYVSFQAARIANGIPDLLYSWYDKEETTTQEIIENLNKAMNIVLGHINSAKGT